MKERELRNLFDDWKEKFINYITSRMTILSLVIFALCGILIYRCFDLQIIHGDEYLNDFMVMTKKTRDIDSTRGLIYDRNGKILAFNELAYSVKIEDVFESGKNKNDNLNETILKLIRMIEQNGDRITSDFKIMIDEDGEFAFTVEGTSRLRFIADIYGAKTINDLTPEQKEATASDIMKYLSKKKGVGYCYAIGQYQMPEDSKTDFIPGKGYSKEEWLKLVTIRYAMSLTSYRKYIGTMVATNVSEKTVAVIMENSDILPGVSIVEDTIRKYVDSTYFAHVLGYTGKISQDELTELNERIVAEGGEEDTYSINDVVGKSGIESYMETTLHGKKGYEEVIVDTTGKVMSIVEHIDPETGNDVYLTIDKDLTIAAYHIVEQKLAGLVASKIINAKEYIPAPNAKSSAIKIPIYDVYFQMINNSIIDMKHFTSPDAGEVEKEVYEKYLTYKEQVYDQIRKELTTGNKPYNMLSKEHKVYQTNIVILLKKNGVLMSDAIDSKDATQIAWAEKEVISLSEYLKYCIAMNWIDISMLELDMQYSDSAEVYEILTEYIISMVDKNTEFQKKLYKYMLLKDVITGKQICKILCEQGEIEVPVEEEQALYDNRITAFDFMMNRIENLDITPAQLALDPCNASVVITDVNNGDVLALVTYPGYDNNKMANSIDAKYYAKMNSDKSNPQYNFATQYCAAPGSTFKMVMATAGLMENIIDVNSKISCVGTFREITPSPKCWSSGHGSINVQTAIRQSCNYFFYSVGYSLSTRTGVMDEQAGLNTIYKYADMYGLTEKTGIQIAENAPKVSDIDPVRSAIGQGSNSFSTVSLARYVATIANRGTCYDLTLLAKVTDSKGTVLEEFEPVVRNQIEMPDAYWDVIHAGMRQVVEGKRYFNDLTVKAAGKTGTAEQTINRPNHALFVCFAPYDKPEIAVATRIPFGYSSDHAAQFTRDILKYYYNLVEKDELINGTASTPDDGITDEM